jgi:hypothetical protein
MVGREIEFLPETPERPACSLFFANRGQKKLFNLLKVRTLNEFGARLREVTPEDLDNMVWAGLIWDPKYRNITLEEVEDIVQDYYIYGKNYDDLNEVIMDALAVAHIIDENVYNAAKNLKGLSPEELEKKMLEILAKNKEEADKLKGEDKGEVLESLT